MKQSGLTLSSKTIIAIGIFIFVASTITSFGYLASMEEKPALPMPVVVAFVIILNLLTTLPPVGLLLLFRKALNSMLKSNQ